MTDLLLVVPHPDDEVFGCGGMFARMSAHGRSVATLTLTRGRAGRSLDLCSRDDLPAVREDELRASLQALGVEDATIFDYPDYVPDASRGLEPHPGLEQVDPVELTGRIAQVIADRRPRTVLTFPPNGSNGHPDHVTTHRLTLAALEASGHRPERVAYFASDAAYEGAERPGFLAPEALRLAHLAPTHVVEVGPFIEAKLRAMAQHETQALSVVRFMRSFARRLLVETFHQAVPAHPFGSGAHTVPWL